MSRALFDAIAEDMALAAAIIETGLREAAERAGDETAGEARERCERAMP